MKKFEIIEGGNNPDYQKILDARQALKTMVIELLRELVRSENGQRKVLNAIFELNEKLCNLDSEHYLAVISVLGEIGEETFGYRSDPDQLSHEMRSIVGHSIQLAADLLGNDRFAKARASKSADSVRQSIKWEVIAKEKKARKNGWSYVEHITGDLPPIQGKPAPISKKKNTPANNKK